MALLLLAGCPNGDTGAGTLTVTWKMQSIDGAALPCPSGYDKMRVSAANYDPEVGYTGFGTLNATVESFDCAAGTGVLELPGGPDYTGLYSVWFENTDATGAVVFMTDHHFDTGHDNEKFHVDVTSGSATLSIPMYPNAGFVRLEWSFIGDQIQANLASCADAGADRIEISFVEQEGATSTKTFPCDGDNEGLDLLGARTVGGAVQPLSAGFYTMRAKAFSGTTEVGATSPQRAGETDKPVEDRNRITSVTAAEFSIHIPGK